MGLTIEEKLQCMTANRNALRKEVRGLHLVINKLRGRLGLKPLFKDLPHRCDKCKNWNDKSILANFCYNCGRPLRVIENAN